MQTNEGRGLVARTGLIVVVGWLVLALSGCAAISAKRVGVICPEDTRPAVEDRKDKSLLIYCARKDGGETHGPYAVICKEYRGGILPSIEQVCENGQYADGDQVEAVYLRDDGSAWRKCRWEAGVEQCFDYDLEGNGTTVRDVDVAGYALAEVLRFDPDGVTTSVTYRFGTQDLCTCPAEISVGPRLVTVTGETLGEACRGCEGWEQAAPWSLGNLKGPVEEVTLRCPPDGLAQVWVPVPNHGVSDEILEWVLVAKGDLRGNQRIGTWESYYENGSLRVIEAHGNDRVNTTIYRPDGTKSAEGAVIDGHRHGEWLFFDEGGTETWRGRYVTGMEQGLWTLSAPDGSLVAEGQMVNGQRDGVWKERDLRTNRIVELDYSNGELLGPANRSTP